MCFVPLHFLGLYIHPQFWIVFLGPGTQPMESSLSQKGKEQATSLWGINIKRGLQASVSGFVEFC